MLLPSRLLRLLIVCLAFLPSQAFAQGFDIPADEWQQPRTGKRVRDLPAVQAAVGAMQGSGHARLWILHEAGEEGSLWGAELRDWLVSLGVPIEKISLKTAEFDGPALRLEVREGAGAP